MKLSSVLYFLCCTTSVFAADKSPFPLMPPESLVFTYGGMGGGERVTTKYSSVVYEEWNWEMIPGQKPEHKVVKKIVVTPSSEKWASFMHKLNKDGVYAWAGDYPNPPETYDGAQWSIKLKFGTREMSSQGNNNYPNGNEVSGKPGLVPSRDFSALLRALNELIGEGVFK